MDICKSRKFQTATGSGPVLCTLFVCIFTIVLIVFEGIGEDLHLIVIGGLTMEVYNDLHWLYLLTFGVKFWLIILGITKT